MSIDVPMLDRIPLSQRDATTPTSCTPSSRASAPQPPAVPGLLR
jgi:hypothetical protein